MQAKDYVRETVSIGTRITESMAKAVEKVLQTNGHLNASDYLRDLIREDLEKRGLLQEARALPKTKET
jgi:Arc/MetJ-type ribon-helix-helix transcriptional regulator